MMNTAVSKYLQKAPSEWKPICNQLRSICLEEQYGLEEEWKWGPNYSYNGLVVGWAYFKKHIKITFFNGVAVKKNQKHFNHCLDNAFNRSIKIDAKYPFDEEVFRACLKESIAVNKKGFKRVSQKKELLIPEIIAQMLAQHQQAKSNFEALPPSHKKEYITWVTEAKREETKNKRVATMKAMLEENKGLHDKYR